MKSKRKCTLFILAKKICKPKKYYKSYIMFKSKQLFDNKDGFQIILNLINQYIGRFPNFPKSI